MPYDYGMVAFAFLIRSGGYECEKKKIPFGKGGGYGSKSTDRGVCRVNFRSTNCSW